MAVEQIQAKRSPHHSNDTKHGALILSCFAGVVLCVFQFLVLLLLHKGEYASSFNLRIDKCTFILPIFFSYFHFFSFLFHFSMFLWVSFTHSFLKIFYNRLLHWMENAFQAEKHFIKAILSVPQHVMSFIFISMLLFFSWSFLITTSLAGTAVFMHDSVSHKY